MSKEQFIQTLQNELERINKANTAKRFENIIEGFTSEPSPKALLGGKAYRIFNSNDYLGLRFSPQVKKAEYEASAKYGAGPGAVRFISGSLKVHHDLERALASFHGREDSIIFSSAFAANLAILFCMIKGQSADSVVGGNTLVVSDMLNHRSIIDGIRVANLPKENRAIFKHLDVDDLKRILEEKKGAFDRVIVVTDGIFSMLGVAQDLKKMSAVIDSYQSHFKEGVWLVVDDCHGVGAYGKTGRGVEEVFGTKADLLVGTLGKGFGADGGYVVADQVVIDYLRESAATYIYSNPFSPGTAGAALASIELMKTSAGEKLLDQLVKNREYFQDKMNKLGCEFAAESTHPIQPLLLGNAEKTGRFKQGLFEAGILVTNINYPVVPRGRDEIRVQISAAHTKEDLDVFADAWQRLM
ncbi:MAG: 2-amino-3-ketobutyrate coenzyme A ligase [Chlamydiae bacterium]|nr:2-amino-3-ketobutyrate coenzyme A ligase [Chlamydiota bacterium]